MDRSVSALVSIGPDVGPTWIGMDRHGSAYGFVWARHSSDMEWFSSIWERWGPIWFDGVRYGSDTGWYGVDMGSTMFRYGFNWVLDGASMDWVGSTWCICDPIWTRLDQIWIRSGWECIDTGSVGTRYGLGVPVWDPTRVGSVRYGFGLFPNCIRVDPI